MSISRLQFISLLAALGAILRPSPAHATRPPWYPLPPPTRTRSRRALVLSGAGARGSYEAGALKRLYRDVATQGPPFDVICGSSAGAINAAFAALATPEAIQQIEALWKEIPRAGIIQLEPPVQDVVDAGLQIQAAARHGFPANLGYLIRARSLLNAAGSASELNQLGGAVSDAGVRALVQKYPLHIDALQSSLFITATNITRMTSDSFYKFVGPDAANDARHFLNRVEPRPLLKTEPAAPPLLRQFPLHHELTQDNLVDAMVASASMPGVFKPVAVHHAKSNDAELYVDGGVVNNLSVSLATDAGACDITVLMATAPGEMPYNQTTIFGVLQAAYALMHEQILHEDISAAISRNLLQRDRHLVGLNATVQTYLHALQETGWQPLTVRLIRPRAPLDVMTMGFNHQAGIEAAFDAGFVDAARPYVYTMA